VKFGQGAAPPEAYMQKSPGKKHLTWEKTRAARLVADSELAAVARRGIQN